MAIEIYTDGAAKGNPGPGGYGALLRFKGLEKELSQGFRKTTNNRMELLAVIVALEALKSNKHKVTIYSDSKRSEEHTSELQSRPHLVCRLLLEKKKKKKNK